ncbi:MAG: hypothetical protein ABEJ30_05335 [Halorientalis sp.]
MDLDEVSPTTATGLAAVGALAVATGGFLPHRPCLSGLACAVPWVSLAPLPVAALLVVRGWTDRRALALAAVAAPFWATGLFLVATNLAAVVSDPLIGTGVSRTLHRLGAAFYLYGATLLLGGFAVHEGQRPVPGARRAAAILAVAFAVLPLVAGAPPLLTATAGVLTEGLLEAVTLFAVGFGGAVLLAFAAEWPP